MTDVTSTCPVASDQLACLVERLLEEMAAAWGRGERLLVETFFDRHAELIEHPHEAVRLIYEEMCLRQEAGEEISTVELTLRFPHWIRELEIVRDCHQALESTLGPPTFPEVGTSLGEFRLASELGRGSQGRVFLAHQTGLADRPVVLKVTPQRVREHLSLARLQHTHIIPLHAMVDFPARNLRALCMPFLGGATLSSILHKLLDHPVQERTGQSILDALDAAAGDTRADIPKQGGYRQTLACASYTDSICFLGVCLADGLQYAHERGLIHLDIKPSNVLLAADAQPLLLDFHLAIHALPAGSTAQEGIGGTPHHMSPEQELACAATRKGQPVPLAVDGRSDVYSLGRLLHGALADSDHGPDRSLPSLRSRNRNISQGLSDVIQKCLAERPEARYQSAAALAADLRRHLTNLPLEGVTNRSLRERWRKWCRRRPDAGLWTVVTIALIAAGLILVGSVLSRVRDAQNALVEGRAQLASGSYSEAIRTLSRGQARLGNLPGTGRLASELERGSSRARRSQSAAELHAVAERLRFLPGADLPSGPELLALDKLCRAAWETRGLVLNRQELVLDADSEEQIRYDLYDLAQLWLDVRRRLPGRTVNHEEANAILAEAVAVNGSPDSSSTSPGRAAWLHMSHGRSFLSGGRLEQAAQELDQACRLRPQCFWSNYYRGVCAYRQQHCADAVHFFGVAIALAPESAECYYNRGLAHVGLGKSTEARQDYDRALALAPRLWAAMLNRGILYYREGQFSRALADLHQALAKGGEPATVHYNLALVQLAMKDEASARNHLDLSIRCGPATVEARALQERLRIDR